MIETKDSSNKLCIKRELRNGIFSGLIKKKKEGRWKLRISKEAVFVVVIYN